VVPCQIELVDTDESFDRFEPRIARADALAIDIETFNWWNPAEEQISIVQIGFREPGGMLVLICDPQAGLDSERLRGVLELGLQTKVIHNASFDAVKLLRHFGIRTSPVHDTMLAARRNGEKGCSLQALARRHLGIDIDKSEQRGDWSRRPLSLSQLNYAALDVVTTLLLFEFQLAQGLVGHYELKGAPPAPSVVSPARVPPALVPTMPETQLGKAIKLIIARFPGRYSIPQLAASISGQRSGIVGLIIDQTLGEEVGVDPLTVRTEVETLLRSHLIRIDQNERLEPVA